MYKTCRSNIVNKMLAKITSGILEVTGGTQCLFSEIEDEIGRVAYSVYQEMTMYTSDCYDIVETEVGAHSLPTGDTISDIAEAVLDNLFRDVDMTGIVKDEIGVDDSDYFRCSECDKLQSIDDFEYQTGESCDSDLCIACYNRVKEQEADNEEEEE